MTFSILFATYKRDDILRRTLDGYLSLATDGINLELIVIDNACQDTTKTLFESYNFSFPAKYLQQPKPGKNAALKLGIEQAQGEYLVFSDDDAIPDPQWIKAFSDLVLGEPSVDIFGGPIIPDIKDWPSYIDLEEPFIRCAYVLSDLFEVTTDCAPTLLWGPNMALSKRVFDAGFTFNEKIGPTGKDYIMGSESELLLRLENAGYRAKYVPAAKVTHQIRPEQLDLNWLKGRAVRQGKGTAFNNSDKSFPKYFGVPRYIYREIISHAALYLFAHAFRKPTKQSVIRLLNLYKSYGKFKFYSSK